jgi:hypothetical protein
MKELEGKLDWTLLPFEALEGVVKVLEYGVKKYKRDGWRTVPAELYIQAAFRHLIAHQKGELLDSESNFKHLEHCVCDLIFAIYLTREK